MTILVLGASGMIGNAIFQNLSTDFAVYGTYCGHIPDTSASQYLHFDVSDKNELADIFQKTKPDIVVSSLRGDFADQGNRHKELAEYLLKTGGRLIFLSTANVFDGCPFKPHSERDVPCPASGYGDFKYRCEQMLQKNLNDQLTIVRLPKVLSKKRVQMLLARQTPGQIFPLYSNLLMSANTDENVAREIRFIIGHGLSGIYHLTSKDFISYQEFYSGVFTRAGCQNIECKTITMSTESYCAELGNVPVETLHGKSRGKLYLGLSTEEDSLISEFALSCGEIISRLCS
ncbi:MAG: sugar nucleotide-binding protein [Ethanoligenens sp.]